ncbi:MAG: hypothetical protein JXB32_26010 [Deltaproteobacteria bacterium]|nr:hypothetical protein [Deltaproteobacteria bacterium]
MAFVRAGLAPSLSAPMVDGSGAGTSPAAVVQNLEQRVAELRRVLAADVSSLQAELEGIRQRIADLESKGAAVAGQMAERSSRGARDEATLVADHVRDTADGFATSLAAHRSARELLGPVRERGVQRVGVEAVEEYEAIRRRLRLVNGGELQLEDKAYAALERERRVAMQEYADALDRFDKVPCPSVRFVAFVGQDWTMLVAPIPQADLSADNDAGDIRTRVACAFWHAAERAAREIAVRDVPAEYGSVHGLMAVRFGPCDGDLLGVLLDETWSGRPTLEALGIEPHLEVVRSMVPAFESEEPDEDPAASVAADADGGPGGAIRDVARRLGLSLRDLVVTLQNTGLPFPDDTVEPGIEESLRVLLGDAQPPSPSEPSGQTPQPLAPPPPRSPGQDVAARMLAKLVRDRRIGGRHTRVESAYAHHFEDAEKALARRVADYLEKERILLPKQNEGSHHVSVNPRRLPDVGRIIEGTWERMDEIDAL